MRDGSVAGAAPPPEVPPALRDVRDLGAARRVAVVPRWRRVLWPLGLGGLAAIAIFIAGALLAVVASAFAELDDLVLLALAAIVWAPGLFLIGRWLLRKSRQAVVLFEGGLAIHDGSRVRSWRWDDVAVVQRRPIAHRPGVPNDIASGIGVLLILAAYQLLGRRYERVDTTYALVDRNAEVCVLDRWLPDVDELVAEVEARVVARLLPEAEAAFRAGGAWMFGAIAVSRTELAMAARRLPWTAVERLEIAGDELHLVVGGARAGSVKVHDVPNVALLIALLPGLLQRGRAAAVD